MKKILLISISLLIFSMIYGQQIVPYSQYMENKYALNPAVAGSLPYNPIAMSYKRLWSGIDDAPSFQMINSHLSISDRVGIGGKIFNITYGQYSKMGLEATYAYHIPIGASGDKLSIGLSGILYQYALDKSALNLEDPDDEAIIFGSEKLIVPDANFGVYYYGSNYYGGIAVQQLLGRKVNLMNEDYLEQRQVRHYFLHGGYIYDVNANFSLEPSLLVKAIEAGIFQVDINVKGTYKQLVWLGVSYRTQEAVAIMMGFRKDRILFGYAYDIAISDIRKYNVGTHEILFMFKFNRSKPKL